MKSKTNPDNGFWNHDRLAQVLKEHGIGKPNLYSTPYGLVRLKRGMKSVSVEAFHAVCEAIYTDGWNAGAEVGAIRGIQAGKKLTPKRAKGIRVGDVVALNPGVTDRGRGGTVVAVFGDQTVYRQADGSYDSWHDPAELQVIARSDATPAPAPIMADDFADGRSVDAAGRRIALGDRVLIQDGDIPAIVVAIVADKLLAVAEPNGFGARPGDTYFADVAKVRVLQPLADVKSYVCDLIESAKA